MPEPIAGGSESDRDRIEHRVAMGETSREGVDAVERLWRDRLQYGVAMPNGETVSIALTDIYHLLLDNRVLRKPERIELLLSNVFQIRSGEVDRRRALGRWPEEAGTIGGYAILTDGSHLVTLHIVTNSELRRLGRKGDLLWPL